MLCKDIGSILLKSTVVVLLPISRFLRYSSCGYHPFFYLLRAWPLLVCLAAVSSRRKSSSCSFHCTGLALRHFMIRRMTFAAHLNSSKSALTISRYFRLMLMSIIQMIWSLAVTCYTLWFTTIGIPIRTWDNWRHVHSDFFRVDQYPAILLPPLVARAYYFLWWLVPASTIIFVAFFAFGREAVEDYKKWFMWFRRNVLRQTHKTDTKKTSFGSWARFVLSCSWMVIWLTHALGLQTRTALYHSPASHHRPQDRTLPIHPPQASKRPPRRPLTSIGAVWTI